MNQANYPSNIAVRLPLFEDMEVPIEIEDTNSSSSSDFDTTDKRFASCTKPEATATGTLATEAYKRVEVSDSGVAGLA